MNAFDEIWNESIHSEPKQIKSIAAAQKKETSPTSIDKDAMTGVFPGRSAPYEVSLSFCPCGSFRSSGGKRPCKHIYRLAMECGLFTGSFETGVNKNNVFSLRDAVAEIENLPDCCQIAIKEFLQREQLCSSFCVVSSPDLQPLFSCSLLQVSKLSADSFSAIYPTKNDLLPILQSRYPDAPMSKRKGLLFEWCADNPSDVFWGFSFSPVFPKYHRSLGTYLRRKYDSDTEIDSYGLWRFPYGAKQAVDKKFYFPLDEITELLDLYGHNRCKDGFETAPVEPDL